MSNGESGSRQGDDEEGKRIAVVSDALPGWTLDEALDALSGHGVAGVEPRLGQGTHLSTTDRAGVIDAAGRIAAAGIALCGVDATADHPLGHPELDRVVDLASEIGAGFVRIFPPPYDSGRPAAAQLEDAARALTGLRTRGASDLRLLIEPCENSVTPSAELALRVLRESGIAATGVVFDPANMLVEGHLRAEFAVDLLGDWLCHVHVKNLLITRDGDMWRATAATLDGGHLDWSVMLACLRRADYGGWISIDHLSAGPTGDRLQVDVTTLRRLLRAADGPSDLTGAAAAPVPQPPKSATPRPPR
jgi:sugar phosphate isomerase/epimerase